MVKMMKTESSSPSQGGSTVDRENTTGNTTVQDLKAAEILVSLWNMTEQKEKKVLQDTNQLKMSAETQILTKPDRIATGNTNAWFQSLENRTLEPGLHGIPTNQPHMMNFRSKL